jgi:predicted acyltransferase
MDRQESQSSYISHMRGGAVILLIAIKVCIFAKVTSVINHANFGGCTLRKLVSAKD